MHVDVNTLLERSSALTACPMFVVSVQGCSVLCPGCDVPQTHSFERRQLVAVDDLVQSIVAADVAGAVFMGGEPFDQADSLHAVISGVRAQIKEFALLCYSGRYFQELQTGNSAWQSLLKEVDLLVDGPFELDKLITDPIRGSSNQNLNFLTARISPEQLRTSADGFGEVFVRDGEIVFHGDFQLREIAAMRKSLREKYGLDYSFSGD